jgi:hypothetical protein
MHLIQRTEEMNTAEPLVFRQAWRPEPEPGFQPGRVRVGWQAEGFRLKAELEDRDVFNPETRFNQPAFTVGDVLEWFLQPPGSQAYWELHIGPEGQVCQMRMPSQSRFEAVREQGVPREWMVESPKLQAESRIQGDIWEIEAFLPVELLEKQNLSRGEVWKMSFCRYDHNRDPENLILSSSSSFKALNFHTLNDWDEFLTV